MNFETYTITMIMYFIMTFTCSRLLRLWEKNRWMVQITTIWQNIRIHWLHTSGMYRYQEKKKEEQ